ncbi:ABC transporter ATP-binding protein [Nanchangia anserum]|nr:ABC transporter ATP-binding protein [Nanchangia anserum]
MSAHSITKSYGRVVALRDVDLTIAAGQTLAIMGPSGSGKSTLLHCLSGVFTPDSGDIHYDGQVISSLSDAKRSHLRLARFGFVFQDGQLLDELPARENVALPLMLTGTSRSRALAQADATLARLGLNDERKRLPGDMSGGQAQRVAVARALVTNPSIIFADEPTGALDQATGHEVMQLLVQTVEMSDTALVMVTHDANVAGWCHRLVEIRDGRVHADRTLKEASRS